MMGNVFFFHLPLLYPAVIIAWAISCSLDCVFGDHRSHGVPKSCLYTSVNSNLIYSIKASTSMLAFTVNLS